MLTYQKTIDLKEKYTQQFQLLQDRIKDETETLTAIKKKQTNSERLIKDAEAKNKEIQTISICNLGSRGFFFKSNNPCRHLLSSKVIYIKKPEKPIKPVSESSVIYILSAIFCW